MSRFSFFRLNFVIRSLRSRYGLFRFAMLVFIIGTAFMVPAKINVRFALMVEEMFRHGFTIFPGINGYPYPDYFSTWMATAWLTSGGGIPRLTHLQLFIALPTMLCGAGAVQLTFKIGERLRRGAGLPAALLLLLVESFSVSCISFGLDIAVTAATAGMLYLTMKGISAKKTVIWFVLLVFCSYIVRGPLGLFVFSAVNCGFMLFSRQISLAATCGASSAGLLILLFGATRTLILRQGGEELWAQFLFCQFGSRISETNRLTFYIGSAVSMLPVSLPAVCCLLRKRCRNWTAAALLAAFVLPYALLGIIGAGHLRYLFPAFPAAAALAGAAWPRFRIGNHKIRAFTVPLLKILVIVAQIAIAGYMFYRGRLMPAVAPLAGAAVLLPLMRSGIRRDCALLFGAVVLLFTAVFPLVSLREDSSDFVSRADRFVTGTLWMYEVGPDHDDLKYIFCSSQKDKVRYVLKDDDDIHQASLSGGTMKFLNRIMPSLFPTGKIRHYYEKMYPAIRTQDLPAALRNGDAVLFREKRFSEDAVRGLTTGSGLIPQIVLHGKLGHRRYVLVRFNALP